MNRPFDVVIAGAGMTGLTAAALLHDIGVDLAGLGQKAGAATVLRALDSFGYFEADGKTFARQELGHDGGHVEVIVVPDQDPLALGPLAGHQVVRRQDLQPLTEFERPQVMVRDNQTATIRVGDQIPVTTRSSQSTTDPDSPIVTEVQFRDTGTLLTVTPRINAGGQVTMDISQEVSLPGSEPAVGGGGNVSIAQRTIDSSVTVHGGQTVVLGGLIRETRTESKSGIPLLMDIPWLGQLFSTTGENVGRTELIVTINPVVVENQRDAEMVTKDLRQRMKTASEFETSAWEKNTQEAAPEASAD